jgi:hypothetical protein
MLTPPPQQGGGWHAVPPVQLPPDSGAWLISFQLSGGAAQNVTFNRNDPMWVRANSKPDQSHKTDSQITAMYVTSDGKELIVLDKNSNSADEGTLPLHYQLNFNGAPVLDPIIENGGKPFIGGTSQNFLASASSALIIGLAVLIFFIGGVVGRLTK